MGKKKSSFVASIVSRLWESSSDFITKTRTLPLIVCFTFLSLLFVFFRMKSVEQDYRSNALQKKIDSALVDGKDLRAKKATLLSAQNLRSLAQKHSLNAPSSEQIIVIP